MGPKKKKTQGKTGSFDGDGSAVATDEAAGEDGVMEDLLSGAAEDQVSGPTDAPQSSKEEEEAARLARIEKARAEEAEREELERKEAMEKEMEEKRQNMQTWMEKLIKIKREEFEMEEAALAPLRQYLMAHVVPTLTKGLLEVTRARPQDPVEFLAEFLFSNNPGGLNTALGSNFPKEDEED